MFWQHLFQRMNGLLITDQSNILKRLMRSVSLVLVRNVTRTNIEDGVVIVDIDKRKISQATQWARTTQSRAIHSCKTTVGRLICEVRPLRHW